MIGYVKSYIYFNDKSLKLDIPKLGYGQVHWMYIWTVSIYYVCSPQGFHFKLSDDAARTLPPDSQDPLNPIEIPKLTLTLYPESVAHDMAGYLSIALKDLYITVRNACIELI